jgi:preprotein translocase subunit YajC
MIQNHERFRPPKRTLRVKRLPSQELPLTVPLSLLAQAATQTAASAPAGTTPQGNSPPFFMTPLFAMMVALAVLFFLSTRSKKNQERKVQDMLSAIKRGDKIQTIGGIIGTVVEAREHDVLVKVDETNNTKIRFSRKAIHRVLEDEAASTAEKK